MAPVKQRRRGLSAGEFAVAIAECQLAGAECFDDVQDVRADRAGASCGRWPAPRRRRPRASWPTGSSQVTSARSSAGWRARATSLTAGSVATRREDVTFDLDATETKVFGRRKRGAGRSRHGHLAYNSYVVTWAERGRALTSELKGGNQARIKARVAADARPRAAASPRGARADHGRGDSGFYSVELMMGCRKEQMRFTFSATRTSLMWSKLAEIADDAWTEAIDMAGAQVAELPFTPEGWKHEPLRLIVRRVPVSAEEIQATSPRARRRKTIPPEQLQMVLDGELSSTYAYCFIVTDIPHEEMSTAEVEHFHRHRAQIEERFKDAKLGHALRHLPSGKLAANRLWLCCCLFALNLSAFICDLSPAAAASGQAADQHAPLRRHAKTLRRILFCVPGRIVRTARRTIVRLAEGFPHLDLLNATYHAALALPGP